MSVHLSSTADRSTGPRILSESRKNIVFSLCRIKKLMKKLPPRGHSKSRHGFMEGRAQANWGRGYMMQPFLCVCHHHHHHSLCIFWMTIYCEDFLFALLTILLIFEYYSKFVTIIYHRRELFCNFVLIAGINSFLDIAL